MDGMVLYCTMTGFICYADFVSPKKIQKKIDEKMSKWESEAEKDESRVLEG